MYPHTQTHTHTYTHTHTNTCKHVQKYTQARMYIPGHTCKHVQKHMQTRTKAHASTQVYTHSHALPVSKQVVHNYATQSGFYTPGSDLDIALYGEVELKLPPESVRLEISESVPSGKETAPMVSVSVHLSVCLEGG